MPIINKHTTLADFAVQQKQSIEAWFDVALLNNIELTAEVTEGLDIIIPTKDYVPLKIVVNITPSTFASNLMSKHQTLADFATQVTGNIEGWFDVALLNNIELTAEVSAATVLKTVNSASKAAAFFMNKQITSVVDYLASQPGGIGFMQIGNNFKVS